MKKQILMTLLLLSNVALAEVPQMINYQGMLTDADSKVKTGEVNLSFDIYDGADGSAAKVWGPQVFKKVPLFEGRFNVILGATDADGDPIADAFASSDTYLQITDLGEDTESDADDKIISPRQQILSTPYAIKAMSAKNGVSVGTIVSSILNEAQYAAAHGDDLANNDMTTRLWIPVDGRSIAGSRLADVLQDTVAPDLRGRFLRGIDTSGEGRDPKGLRAPGDYQEDLLGSHNHSYRSTDNGQLYDNGHNYAGGGHRFGFVGSKTSGAAGGDETRPKNVAVYYYIKIN